MATVTERKREPFRQVMSVSLTLAVSACLYCCCCLVVVVPPSGVSAQVTLCRMPGGRGICGVQKNGSVNCCVQETTRFEECAPLIRLFGFDNTPSPGEPPASTTQEPDDDNTANTPQLPICTCTPEEALPHTPSVVITTAEDNTIAAASTGGFDDNNNDETSLTPDSVVSLSSQQLNFFQCHLSTAQQRKVALVFFGAVGADLRNVVYSLLPDNAVIDLKFTRFGHADAGRLGEELLPSPADVPGLRVESLVIEHAPTRGILGRFWNRCHELGVRDLAVRHCQISDLFLARPPGGDDPFPNFHTIDFSYNLFTVLHRRSVRFGPKRYIFDGNPLVGVTQDFLRLHNNRRHFSHSVEHISIRYATGPLDLSGLLSLPMPRLRELNVSYTPLTRLRGQRLFQDMPQLERVDFTSCNLRIDASNSLGALFSAPNLTEVRLGDNLLLAQLDIVDWQLQHMDFFDVSSNTIGAVTTSNASLGVRALNLTASRIVQDLSPQLFSPITEALYLSDVVIVDSNLAPIHGIDSEYPSFSSTDGGEGSSTASGDHEVASCSRLINSHMLQFLPRLRVVTLRRMSPCHFAPHPFDPLQHLEELDLAFVELDAGTLATVLESVGPTIRRLNLTGTHTTAAMLEKAAARWKGLESLDISNTQVASLQGLQHTPELRELDVSGTPITTLEPLTTSNAPRLEKLIARSASHLTAIGGTGTLAGHPALRHLVLTDTKMTRLASDALASLTVLEFLDLSDNTRLSRVDPDLLASQTVLQTLVLKRNAFLLPRIPCARLLALDVAGARGAQSALRQLGACQQLRYIDASKSGLDALPRVLALPFLQVLDISENRLAGTLPPVVARMYALTHLFAQKNALEEVTPAELCNLAYLRHLDLSENALRSISSGAGADGSTNTQAARGGAQEWCNEQHATVLLGNNDHLSDILGIFDVFAQVVQLDVSGNRALQLTHTLASSPLLRAIRVLDISSTKSDMTENWCESEDELEVLIARSLYVDKSFNTDYQRVRFLDACFRHLRVLDVSHNARDITLRHLRASVGSLRFPQVSPSLVNSGVTSMAGRGGSGSGGGGGRTITSSSSPDSVLATGSAQTVVRCQSDADTSPGKYLTRLELEGLSAACAMAETRLPATIDLGFSRDVEVPGLQYVCTCIPSHRENDAGECWPQKDPQWPYALAGSLGTLGALLLGFLLFRGVRYWRQVHYDLDLRARLIDEKEMENLQLREAWEVKAADVVLEQRIDAQSPGAFSQVWRGMWLDQAVAVKVLNKAGSGGMLGNTIGGRLDGDEDGDGDDHGGFSPEFRREVEFFMTSCRHKNVVQFLGAGCLHDGSPFIILELVPNGSLDVFIGTSVWGTNGESKSKKNKAKKGRRRRGRSSSSSKARLNLQNGNDDADGGAVDEEEGMEGQLIQDDSGDGEMHGEDQEEGREEEEERGAVSWKQRMRFLQGIARGMGHLHDKGLVHRDLKTANVLVSSSLEPKITDFGTIRTLFQEPLPTGGSSPNRGRMTAVRGKGPTRLDLNAHKSPYLTSAVGTPLYMALEVLTGDGAYTAAADVWSFSIVAWELASQRPPLLLEELGGSSKGPVLGKMCTALTEEKRLPLEHEWPEWLRGLLIRCWNKDWLRRPSFQEISRICDTVISDRNGSSATASRPSSRPGSTSFDQHSF